MDAGISYLENQFKIVNFKHHIKDELSGNPYNCSFDIKVVSGLFSGYAEGCEYDYKEWKNFIQQLENIYNLKSDYAEISEICYGSKIIFKSDYRGHIEVSGKIFGKAMKHTLEFCFDADQTVLPKFIMELKQF